MFTITKRFTAGVLAGLTINDRSPVAFEVGREYRECVGSGRYVVLGCEPEHDVPCVQDRIIVSNIQEIARTIEVITDVHAAARIAGSYARNSATFAKQIHPEL